MKTVRDKMIKEMIPIEQCLKDDQIYIRKGIRSLYNYGSMIIVKVKLLPKSMVQIKYKGTYKTSTVQKGSLPIGTMVERTRKWTKEDGPDAGYIPPETKRIDGVLYTVPPEKETSSEHLPAVIPTADVVPSMEMLQELIGGISNSLGWGSLLWGIPGTSIACSTPSRSNEEPNFTTMKTVTSSDQKRISHDDG